MENTKTKVWVKFETPYDAWGDHFDGDVLAVFTYSGVVADYQQYLESAIQYTKEKIKNESFYRDQHLQAKKEYEEAMKVLGDKIPTELKTDYDRKVHGYEYCQGKIDTYQSYLDDPNKELELVNFYLAKEHLAYKAYTLHGE